MVFDLDRSGNVKVNPEFLLIKEFKKLEEKYKEQTAKYFAYIYFKNDFKSPYRSSYEEPELSNIIKKDIIENMQWEPDNVIIKAEKKYNELQETKTLKTLLSAEKALLQVRKYFDEFNLEDVEEDKKHIAVKNLMTNLKEVDDVVAKIESARTRVEKELTTKTLTGKKVLRKRELPKNKR